MHNHSKRLFLMTLLLAGTALPLHAQTLDFSLFDSYGHKVASQDYTGVPLFLEFGACW